MYLMAIGFMVACAMLALGARNALLPVLLCLPLCVAAWFGATFHAPFDLSTTLSHALVLFFAGQLGFVLGIGAAALHLTLARSVKSRAPLPN